MIKISIILPVFNSAKYLKKCLDSLISQTFKNIEVIAIDDCSTDGSVDILNECANNFENFKLIMNKTNQGVSVCRNIGILNSSGEYVMFCDSDDWYEHNAAEKLFNCAQKNDSEFVFGNYALIAKNKKILRKQTNFFKTNFPTEKEIICFGTIFSYGNLIKKEIFIKNNLFFLPELKICEELPTISVALLKAKNASFIEDCVYNYFQNKTSLSNDKRNDTAYFHHSFKVFSKMIDNKKFRYELEFRAITMLMYNVVLHMCNMNKSNSEIKNYIIDFEMKIPMWFKNTYIKKLGVIKKIFLIFAKFKFMRLLKIFALVHSKFLM